MNIIQFIRARKSFAGLIKNFWMISQGPFFFLPLYYSNLINNISHFVWHNVKLGTPKELLQLWNCFAFLDFNHFWQGSISCQKVKQLRNVIFTKENRENPRGSSPPLQSPPQILKLTHRRAGKHQILAEGKGHAFPTLKYMDEVELLLKIVLMTNSINFLFFKGGGFEKAG